ncbi:hypothetical protein L3Y34_013483 [Caenorhabditis briggsae]|uniref:Uncharacterized protein n=1 Tax=Caenorhabditis briggsae TaxID=6238 RepID=A0AAE8ZV12_CAEBR|nr:hypothetical protein L3Y34_013483 [Caenorhabditis briggsae]
MFFFMLVCYFLLQLCFQPLVSQFFDAETPWQFAGFAAINIPTTDNNNDISSYYPSFPYLQQQQLQLQQLQNANQQQQQQQQSFITTPHNSPLLPSAVLIPKQLPNLSRGGSTLEHATYLSLINDKENFQASGCGWDLIRLQCHDLFGLCKGGCRDFAIAINSPIHDCRCIPFGYLALVKLAGK